MIKIDNSAYKLKLVVYDEEDIVILRLKKKQLQILGQ